MIDVIWQDAIILAIQFGFLPALLPVFRAPVKPPVSACAMNAVLLWVLVSTFATMGLWLSVVGVSVPAVCWTVLTGWRRKQPKTPVIRNTVEYGC